MNSLVSGFVERQPIPQNLLRTVRLLGEFRGREEMFKKQLPQALETLRQVGPSSRAPSRATGLRVSPRPTTASFNLSPRKPNRATAQSKRSQAIATC